MTYQQLNFQQSMHPRTLKYVCFWCSNREQLDIHTSIQCLPIFASFLPPVGIYMGIYEKTNKNKIDCSVPRSSSESSLMGHLDCNANEADQKLGCHLSNSLHRYLCTMHSALKYGNIVSILHGLREGLQVDIYLKFFNCESPIT